MLHLVIENLGNFQSVDKMAYRLTLWSVEFIVLSSFDMVFLGPSIRDVVSQPHASFGV